MCESAIFVVVKVRRKSKDLRELESAEGCATGPFVGGLGCCSAAGESRVGTVAVWRRLHAPPERGTAARVPETQDEADGMRDASEGEFSEALRRSLQAKLSTACPHALLSRCNACIFRRRSDANLRTANCSSQLDVAREERRGRRSWLQKRQGLLDERAVSLGCFCRERRRERALCRCNANRFGSCRWSQLPRTWKEGPNGRPSATTGRQRVLGSVRVRERRRVFWKSPFSVQ